MTNRATEEIKVLDVASLDRDKYHIIIVDPEQINPKHLMDLPFDEEVKAIFLFATPGSGRHGINIKHIEHESIDAVRAWLDSMSDQAS